MKRKLSMLLLALLLTERGAQEETNASLEDALAYAEAAAVKLESAAARQAKKAPAPKWDGTYAGENHSVTLYLSGEDTLYYVFSDGSNGAIEAVDGRTAEGGDLKLHLTGETLSVEGGEYSGDYCK